MYFLIPNGNSGSIYFLVNHLVFAFKSFIPKWYLFIDETSDYYESEMNNYLPDTDEIDFPRDEMNQPVQDTFRSDETSNYDIVETPDQEIPGDIPEPELDANLPNSTRQSNTQNPGRQPNAELPADSGPQTNNLQGFVNPSVSQTVTGSPPQPNLPNLINQPTIKPIQNIENQMFTQQVGQLQDSEINQISQPIKPSQDSGINPNTPLIRQVQDALIQPDIQQIEQLQNSVTMPDTQQNGQIPERKSDPVSELDKQQIPDSSQMVNSMERGSKSSNIQIKHIGGTPNGPVAIEENLEQAFLDRFSDNIKGMF